MPPRAMNDEGATAGESVSRPIKRVGSMGDISVTSDEKPSNVYTTRKSTLIGYVSAYLSHHALFLLSVSDRGLRYPQSSELLLNR